MAQRKELASLLKNKRHFIFDLDGTLTIPKHDFLFFRFVYASLHVCFPPHRVTSGLTVDEYDLLTPEAHVLLCYSYDLVGKSMGLRAREIC